MMDLATFNRTIISPSMAFFPPYWDSTAARHMLLAITQQEDPQQLRRQMGGGPARGLWQFEMMGGTAGVMKHAQTRKRMQQICAIRGVAFFPRDVWEALEKDDLLACAAARCLLYTDSRPLPKRYDALAGWDYYMWNWRPGKPHPNTWSSNFQRAGREAYK